METKNKVSAGMGFAAGALFGAIAVFVPFVSVGHPRTNGERAGERVSSSPSTPAAGARRTEAKKGAAASTKTDASEPPKASNEASCDVQLD
ncbi:MAG: hypothetical protein M3167_14475 [Acidobacteriota bacterium]|nr:hypothetical protein [Acidobacteriota bacterium]